MTDKSLMDFFTKKYGPNFAKTGKELRRVDRLKTGLVVLDIAYGGGVPLARSIEIYGPESLGKTTLALTVMASAQAAGIKSCYIDLEHTLQPEHCVNAGVDLDEALVLSPSDGNEAFDSINHLIEKSEYRFFVIDSIPGLVPKSDLEKFTDDSDAKGVAGVAALFARQWPVLKEYSRESGATFLFLNQVSSKIGFMASGLDTPGGWRRKHLMTHRLNLKYKSQVKNGNNVEVGSIETHFFVEKSKVGSAGVEGSIIIRQGVIDKAHSLLTTAEGLGLVSRSGAYYKLNEDMQNLTSFTATLGMGAAKACATLRENPIIWEALYSNCIKLALGEEEIEEEEDQEAELEE